MSGTRLILQAVIEKRSQACKIFLFPKSSGHFSFLIFLVLLHGLARRDVERKLCHLGFLQLDCDCDRLDFHGVVRAAEEDALTGGSEAAFQRASPGFPEL